MANRKQMSKPSKANVEIASYNRKISKNPFGRDRFYFNAPRFSSKRWNICDKSTGDHSCSARVKNISAELLWSKDSMGLPISGVPELRYSNLNSSKMIRIMEEFGEVSGDSVIVDLLGKGEQIVKKLPNYEVFLGWAGVNQMADYLHDIYEKFINKKPLRFWGWNREYNIDHLKLKFSKVNYFSGDLLNEPPIKYTKSSLSTYTGHVYSDASTLKDMGFPLDVFLRK